MFGNNFFGGMRLKAMSAFTCGLIASTSVYSAENQAKISADISKEIRSGGLTYGLSVIENQDYLKGIESLFKAYGVQDMEKTMKAVSLWDKVSKDLGFADIDGSGFSVVKENGNYLMDLFMHAKDGHEGNTFWKLIGGNAEPLVSNSVLPENTILSGAVRVDLVPIWKFIKNDLPKLDHELIPKAQLDVMIQQVEQQALMLGAPVEDFLKALSTEMNLFVTMDDSRTMTLPNTPPLPTMSISFLIKKESELIQNLLLGFSQQMQPEKSKVGGFDVVTMPMPLPTATAAGFAYDKDWLILTSDIKNVDKIVEAQSGKSLVKSAKFKQFSSMVKPANNSFYMSGEIYDLVKDKLQVLPEEMKSPAASLDYTLFQGNRPEFFYLGYKKQNGFKAEVSSTFNLPQGNMLTSVAVAGIVAAMVLPALGKARQKAKMAKSKSRLKQMGTTVAMYFTDGGSAYPKDFTKFDFDPFILAHPTDEFQVTLKDMMEGNSKYLFLIKSGERYEGSRLKPMIMEKPGVWGNSDVNVVFEDGHVEQFNGNTVEEVLNNIKARYK
ncbi:MAG: hypothetical protein NE334_20025 [Lentisphaeraceae bacterium]|nr:hypothetical protein [Lentisphaeraceae bacterium]